MPAGTCSNRKREFIFIYLFFALLPHFRTKRKPPGFLILSKFRSVPVGTGRDHSRSGPVGTCSRLTAEITNEFILDAVDEPK